jgi:hypothetical protein
MSDLRVRTFGGWADVDALLAAYGGAVSAGPSPSVEIFSAPAGLSGQTGIRMREALLAGDARTAASLAHALDEPHRIELLLGAALRDARGGWAAARLFLAADTHGAALARWWPVCRLLAEPGADHTLDELASAYVAEGRAPDVWPRTGAPAPRIALDEPFADVAVAAALAAGVSGGALLDALADRPLFPAVAHYYRRGTLHALGVRPLLVLAASPTILPGAHGGL